MRLVILGAGGYGRTVADVTEQSGKYKSILLLYDAGAIKCNDYVNYISADTEFFPAFGNNQDRVDWLHRLADSGCKLSTLVHPTAYVSPRAKLLPGTVVLPHAIVNTDCEVKAGCIINCGAIIDHGCVLEEGVHVGLGAVIKAENRIPSCMKIEAGRVIENRTYSL